MPLMPKMLWVDWNKGMASDRPMKLLSIAREIAVSDASFREAMDPGRGKRTINEVMHVLRVRAKEEFGADLA